MHFYPAYETVATRVRESARRKLRELFFTWLFGIVAIFLFLNWLVSWDIANIFVAVIISTVLFLPMWFMYKVVRFTIGS